MHEKESGQIIAVLTPQVNNSFILRMFISLWEKKEYKPFQYIYGKTEIVDKTTTFSFYSTIKKKHV